MYRLGADLSTVREQDPSQTVFWGIDIVIDHTGRVTPPSQIYKTRLLKSSLKRLQILKALSQGLLTVALWL